MPQMPWPEAWQQRQRQRQQQQQQQQACMKNCQTSFGLCQTSVGELLAQHEQQQQQSAQQ